MAGTRHAPSTPPDVGSLSTLDLYAAGVTPTIRLHIRVKCAWSLNPAAAAILEMEALVVPSWDGFAVVRSERMGEMRRSNRCRRREIAERRNGSPFIVQPFAHANKPPGRQMSIAVAVR